MSYSGIQDRHWEKQNMGSKSIEISVIAILGIIANYPLISSGMNFFNNGTIQISPWIPILIGIGCLLISCAAILIKRQARKNGKASMHALAD